MIFTYTFLFLFLKVNETVRFWALISFTGGYAMHLVNPADNGEGKRWGFDFHGYAENAARMKRLEALSSKKDQIKRPLCSTW